MRDEGLSCKGVGDRLVVGVEAETYRERGGLVKERL